MTGRRPRHGGPDDQDRIEHARLWLPLGRGAAAAGLPPRTARVLDLAAECGAAVAPVLAASSAVEAERQAVQAALEQVVRPAVGIARGLVALPVVVVPVLALVLDIDLWAFWTGDPLGRVVGVVVLVMVAAAALWLRLLVVAATRPAVAASVRRVTPGAPALAVVFAVGATAVLGWWAGVAVAAVGWWLTRRPAPSVSPGLDEVADLAAVAAAAGHDLCGALRLAAARVPDPIVGDAVARLALRLALSPPRLPPALHTADLPASLDTPRPLVSDPGPSTDGGRRPGTTVPRDTWHPGPAGHDVGDDRIAPLERLVVDLLLTGQPAAAPLRRLGRRLRRIEADRVRVAVARLPGRLTFPTALLLVPATVLAIGTPIAMRGLQAIGGP